MNEDAAGRRGHDLPYSSRTVNMQLRQKQKLFHKLYHVLWASCPVGQPTLLTGKDPLPW